MAINDRSGRARTRSARRVGCESRRITNMLAVQWLDRLAIWEMSEEPSMSIRTGACQCGRIRIAASAEPLTVSMCHCQDCQRRTGCGSAWNKDPLSGVIGVQTGPP